MSYFLRSMSSVTRRAFRGTAADGRAACAGAAGRCVWLAAKPAPVRTPTATAPALLRTRKSRREIAGRGSCGLPDSFSISSEDLGGTNSLLSAMGISLFQDCQPAEGMPAQDAKAPHYDCARFEQRKRSVPTLQILCQPPCRVNCKVSCSPLVCQGLHGAVSRADCGCCPLLKSGDRLRTPLGGGRLPGGTARASPTSTTIGRGRAR